MLNTKFLKGLPSPYCDETFSSWLVRSASRKRTRLSLNDVEDYIDGCLKNRGDYDFDFGVAFRVFCVANDLDQVFCRRHFTISSKSSLAGVMQRNTFCRKCLDEDVKKRGTPYWRKSWCRFDVAFCMEHKTLLQTTRDDFGIYRAWDSFSEFSDCNYRTDAEKNIFEFTCLRFLAYRSQSWLWRNTRLIEGEPALGKSVRLLLMSFLSLRTAYQPPGLGRILFNYDSRLPIVHRDYHYSLCMYYGCRDSTSRMRMASLIALGIVLGLYNSRELRSLQKSCIGFYLPTNSRDLGVISIEFLSVAEKDWYIAQFPDRRVFSGLPVSSAISDFICGVKASRPRR